MNELERQVMFDEWWDDGMEMEIEEALRLLEKHGFKDVTEEANKQNKANNTWVFEAPNGHGVYYCDEEFEVIDIVSAYELA